MPTPDQIKRILVIRFSSIGDIILTTPLLRCLRQQFPDAQIHFLTKVQFVDLIRHNPNINEVIGFDSKKEKNALSNLRKKLRENNYDWVIDLHQNLRSLYLKRGFFSTSYPKHTFKRWLITNLNQRNIYLSPIYERYFEAVQTFGIRNDNLGTEVFFQKENTEKIQLLFSEKGISPSQKILTICTGASAFTKRWFAERFAEVADHFAQKNYKIVFIGGKEDHETSEKIINMMQKGNESLNLAGKCSLLDSAAVLQQSEIVLTHDTGMMHLAQSQKCPVVAIFGATTRHFGFFPTPEKSIVVEKQLACRPCSFHGGAVCPRGHFDCMKTIEAREVIESLEKLVGKSKIV